MGNDGRIKILDVKCGSTEGGIACGPISGEPVYSVRYEINGVKKWIHNAEVEGIPNFFISDEDLHDKFLDDDYINKNIDYINSLNATEFEGLCLDEYESMIHDISENLDNPAVPFVRFLLRLYCSDSDGINQLIQDCQDKYADELPLPPFDFDEEIEATIDN